MKVVEKALKRGSKSLSEYESKQLLAEYGIVVTKEAVAITEEEVVATALKLGYPVVCKASGEEFTHKTELDLIELNIKDETDARAAFQRLTSHPEISVREILVQQMIKGDRELVVGLTRDPQFGPCVMFGLGGIFTEILQDVTFRIAPLRRQDAMI